MIKLFATITALLGALGLLSLRLGATSLDLKDVQVSDYRYIYTCDGTEITAKEYANLAKPNAPPVKCPVHKVLKFNTISGKLSDGDKYTDNGITYIKVTGIEDVVQIGKDTLKGATLTDTKIQVTDLDKLLKYGQD